METGIDRVATVWLVCLAVASALLCVVSFLPQAKGAANKAKVFLIPITPLVYVLFVEGFKGHSVRQALVFYSDVMILGAVVAIAIPVLARGRAGSTSSMTEDERIEQGKRDAKRIGAVLLVFMPLLLLLEYGPIISW